MLSYGQLKSRFTDLTKDSSTTNDTRGGELINELQDEILGMRDWHFMEKTRTATSVVNQANYRLSPDYGRTLSLWTTVGGVRYTPEEVTDLEYWNYLNSTSESSDITTHFIILEDFLYLYPTPSSTSITITHHYRQRAKEMSASDYTTGTITNTIGNRTVVGTGTNWTNAMEGRWIRIAGRWYEIYTVDSPTQITLYKATVEGANSSSYRLGEISPIPGEFHDLLWKGPVATYFDFKGDENPFRVEYEKRLAMFIKRHGSGQKSSKQVIRPVNRPAISLRDPNDYPTGLSG